MQRFFCQVLVVGCLSVAVCFNGAKAENSSSKGDASPHATPTGKRAPTDLTAQLKKQLASLHLPPDVLARATKIVDEYGPQYVACQVKRNAIFTDEQRTIHDAKVKANQAAGKKGPDVLDGVLEAVNFSPEQRKQWDEIQAKKRAIGIKMNAALRGVLNEEQQAKFGLPTKEEENKASYAD